MGIRINDTGAAVLGQRGAERASNRLQIAQERASSLLRINRASDDAAGLAIAERFRTQVLQLNQEIQNIQSGINLSQTAEGAIDGQAEAVSRIRELALQSANGTLTDNQRAALNEEAQQLLQGIDTTAQNTQFNGLNPLDGTTSTVTLDPAGTAELTFQESTVSSLGLTGLDISTQAGATAAIDSSDTAQETLSTNRAALGAQTNDLTRAIDQREQSSLDLQEAESRIRDLDVALASIERARDEILLRSGIASVAQGNLQSQTALRLLGG